MSTLVLYTGLLDLPNELIEEILTHLHPLNIVTCRRVSNQSISRFDYTIRQIILTNASRFANALHL